MNKKLIYGILIIIILVVIVIAGVSLLLVKTRENIINANLDSAFQLKINQTAIIKSENLKVKFVNVTEDSRCPSTIFCFMAGQVTVAINVSKNGQNLDNFNLTLPGENPDLDFVTENIKNFDGYSIKLVKVDPYPEFPDEKIESSDYIATFIVSKGVIGQINEDAAITQNASIIKKICNEPAERSACKISDLYLCEKGTEKIYRAVVSKEVCTDQPIRYFDQRGNLLGLCAVPWGGENSEGCENFYSFECNPKNLCEK